MYDDIRAIVPEFKEDQIMYPIVQKVKEYLMQ
jgi:histidine ammonia-lyase